jgi:hypothetical protein
MINGKQTTGITFSHLINELRLQRPFFLSRTSKVKVLAGMNLDFDEHNRARIWARLRIRHGSG